MVRRILIHCSSCLSFKTCKCWCKNFSLHTTEVCYLMTFRCPFEISITSCWLFTARWSTWPGKSPGPMCSWVGRILRPDSCTSVSSWSKVHRVNLVCSCASLSTSFALSQSVTWFSSTAWSVMLTYELHWRFEYVYQLWKGPLLSCARWSWDQTSCLSPQCMSWSSCNMHESGCRIPPTQPHMGPPAPEMMMMMTRACSYELLAACHRNLSCVLLLAGCNRWSFTRRRISVMEEEENQHIFEVKISVCYYVIVYVPSSSSFLACNSRIA